MIQQVEIFCWWRASTLEYIRTSQTLKQGLKSTDGFSGALATSRSHSEYQGENRAYEHDHLLELPNLMEQKEYSKISEIGNKSLYSIFLLRGREIDFDCCELFKKFLIFKPAIKILLSLKAPLLGTAS